MSDVTIVCPSKGRAGNVTAVGAFGEHLILVVPAREVAAYQEAYPWVEVVPEPSEVRNIGQARQEIYDRFAPVFMVDDDATHMAAVAEVPTRRLRPDEARDVIQRVADMAEAMGLKMFGVSETANPLHFSPMRPFKLTGELGGAVMGLHPDDKLRFPPWPLGEDTYISGLNAYHHRALLVDLRYALPHTMNDAGGVAHARTARTGRLGRLWLQEAFGDAIFDPKIEGDLYPYGLKVPW